MARFALCMLFMGVLLSSCSGDSSGNSSGTRVSIDGHVITLVPREELLSAKVGDTVSLDGHEETCSNKSQIAYAWSIDAIPAGSVAALSDAAVPIPTLKVDEAGTYRATLKVVCHGETDTRAHYTLMVTLPKHVDVAHNAKPVAVPVAGSSVKVGSVVMLDGRGSRDADGDALLMMWRIVAKPAASNAQLQNVVLSPSDPATKILNEANKQFVADVQGKYKIGLTVNDGMVDSDEAFVDVVVTADSINAKPVAHAGIDQTVQLGSEVILSSSGSHDADSSAALHISYRWSINHQPAGSSMALSSATVAEPRFTPQVAGQYVIQLVVSDSHINSDPDFVTINVIQSRHAESLHEKLHAMGLDDADALHLESNHKAEAEAVVAIANKFFNGVSIEDGMFKASNDKVAAIFDDVYPVMGNWEERHKTRFRKIFGRINFVVNSPKFKDAFDNQINLLDMAHQGVLPAIAYPNNFEKFKVDSNSAIEDGGKAFEFFISESKSGVAYGSQGLRLGVERQGMMGDASPDGQTKGWSVNGAAALIFHELTHSIGYVHEPNGAPTQLKPNNIPYFVQIIAGYSATNIMGVYCNNDPSCSSPQLQYGNPQAVFTQYFGDN